MFALLLYCFYFVDLLTAYGSGGLFNYVFGLQKYCFCRCGVARHITDAARSGRLLGGEVTAPHRFPWLATVNAGEAAVGGSLISDRHVITAASPLYGLSAGNVTVTLGAHDRCAEGDPSLLTSVATIALHPGYSPSNTDNDIALVRLRHVIAFSEFIAPVCMPFLGSQEQGKVAWTASWLEDNGNSTCTPRVATLPMLPRRSCLIATKASAMTPDKGCLGPLGSRSIVCQNDIGAPVMSRWLSGAPFRLVGVISSASCHGRVAPLYTRVVEHYDWIHSHIRADCQCF